MLPSSTDVTTVPPNFAAVTTPKSTRVSVSSTPIRPYKPSTDNQSCNNADKRRSSLNQAVKTTDMFGTGHPVIADPERHQTPEDGSNQNHPLLAKLKVEAPLCEEEKREPLEEPKVGALKSRLDQIKQEFYAGS